MRSNTINTQQKVVVKLSEDIAKATADVAKKLYSSNMAYVTQGADNLKEAIKSLKEVQSSSDTKTDVIHQQDLVNLENKHTIELCNMANSKLQDKVDGLTGTLTAIETHQPNVIRLLSESNLIGSSDNTPYTTLGTGAKTSIKDFGISVTDTNKEQFNSFKAKEFDSKKAEQVIRDQKAGKTSTENKSKSFWTDYGLDN